VRCPALLHVASLGFIVLACAPRNSAGAPEGRRNFTLFHTADVHSYLFDTPLEIDDADAARGLGPAGLTARVGGAARLATVLDRERAHADRSLYLDAGDLLEGTAVFTLFHGTPEMETFDLLGLDAAAVGNHDLTAGDAAFANLRAQSARFPALAANLPAELANGVALPWVARSRDGVTVGVVGLGHLATSAPDIGAAAEAVQGAVGVLRAQADVIVVLSHLGSDLDTALVPRTTGIDVVLGGHTHDVLEPNLVDDCDDETASRFGCTPRRVPIVHPGAYGRYLGRVDLVVSDLPVDRAGADPRAPSVVTSTRVSLVPVNENVPPRADVQALLAPYQEALVEAGFESPFAFAPADLTRAPQGGDSALGNFVADSLLESAGADLAMVNTEGIRADVPAGTVTLDDVVRVVPFEDRVATLETSGAALSSAFTKIAESSCGRGRESQVQIAGATVVFDCAGSGTATVSVGARPLDRSATYRVVTTSFLTEAGGWLAISSAPASISREGLRDAVIARLRTQKPCAVAPTLPCWDEKSGAVVDGRVGFQ